MDKIFIDSSAWIAFAVGAEPRHKEILRSVEEALKASAGLFTSNDVVDETLTRLVTTVGFHKTKLFYTHLGLHIKKGYVRQLWVDEVLQGQAWEVLEKFSDHKLSFTDATSIAIMKRYAIPKILTLDSDFAKIGVPVLP